MWTDERVATATEMWLSGDSASQIANRLGQVTRNGVIGKMHRLKVPSPMRRMFRVSEPLRQTNKAAAQSRELHHRIIARRGPKMKPDWPTGEPWDPLPGSTPIGIMELSNNTCRWPIGEGPFRYCGCEPETDSVYCAQHKAIAHRPPVFPANNSEAILASDTPQKPLSGHDEYAPSGRADLHELSTQ